MANSLLHADKSPGFPTHLLSQVENLTCSQSKDPVPSGLMNSISSIIAAAKSDVIKLRTALGLHRLETEKTRFERWEITAAKMMAINEIEKAVSELPPVPTESDELLFQKLNLSLFRDWLVDRLAELEFNNQGLFFAEDRHENSLAIAEVENVLKAFDILGNAGVQPKDKEGELESIGLKPVTVPAPRISDLHRLIPGSNQKLCVADLTRISEWCLDRLEELEPVRWSPEAGAVGEGDMPA